MRAIEADWIRDTLLALGPDKASPVANLGSSTAYFRAVKKPHIEEQLMRPLREAGFDIFHCDMKAEDGVDLAGDLNDPALIDQLRAKGFRSLICSNMLEHVTDPAKIARACEAIVPPGGHIIVTVPKVYPWHPDPIDTLFRPDPAALARLFTNSRILAERVFVDGTPMRDERRKGIGNLMIYPLRTIWHVFSGLWRPAIARAALSRLINFGRPIEISGLLLERRAD